MKPVVLMLVLAMTACSTPKKQQPVAKFDPAEPIFKRYSAFKEAILYSYRVDPTGKDSYGIVLADADKWCSQYKMIAVERSYPSCQEYVYADEEAVRYCSVSFKCQ